MDFLNPRLTSVVFLCVPRVLCGEGFFVILITTRG